MFPRQRRATQLLQLLLPHPRQALKLPFLRWQHLNQQRQHIFTLASQQMSRMILYRTAKVIGTRSGAFILEESTTPPSAVDTDPAALPLRKILFMWLFPTRN